MKAFWWFKENSIAGMARPGFNAAHWFDLPFDEAVLLGWIGQFSSGSENLESFNRHLQEYAPKIFKFYNLDSDSGSQSLKVFDSIQSLLDVADRLSERTQILESFQFLDKHIHFNMNTNRLKHEINFLKNQNVSSVISLTERHHNNNELSEHFNTHHFSIKDLGAPEIEQVVRLSDILRESKKKNEKIAVHCLAGIGRTSTMLMAAHILLGEKLEDLKRLISKQNPTFAFTGSQAEFINKVADQYGARK